MKKVTPITFDQIPFDIRVKLKDSNWSMKETKEFYVERYNFYLVDGELYTQSTTWKEEEQLLYHWSHDANFLYPPTYKELFPCIRVTGEHLFELLHSEDYETSVRSTVDGKIFVVHTG